MLTLWVYEYLNGRFGHVGDVGIMCVLQLYSKLFGIYLSVKSLRKAVDYQWNTAVYSYWKDYPGTLIIGRN
jgi:hypothetical protein